MPFTGEQTKKQWAFTVGIYDTSEPPVPEGATIVKELPISPDHILPGSKAASEFFIIVYQDKNGKRYTSYKLVTPSGMALQSSNLAFIARALGSDKKGTTFVRILPRLTFAFAGNQITFSYEYEFSTPGTIVKETWDINSGGHAYSEPTITIVSAIPRSNVNCWLNILTVTITARIKAFEPHTATIWTLTNLRSKHISMTMLITPTGLSISAKEQVNSHLWAE